MIDETEIEEKIALAEQCSEDKEIKEAFKAMLLHEGEGSIRKLYDDKFHINHPKHQLYKDGVNKFLDILAEQAKGLLGQVKELNQE